MASAATSLHAPTFLRWRTQRWPRTNLARWVVRLAVAVPFVGLADLANAAGGPSAANDLLHRQAASLHWASGQLGWVAHAYPPVPLAIARLFPGGALGLAIAGGLCTGVLIQLTIERLMLRSVSALTAVLLTAGVALTPAFWFVATQDFSAFLTLSLLSVALTGLLDFTINRSTESGFIAGIGFGLATMCNPAALPFAVAGALATLFVAPQARAVREIARRRAAATVVLFPSAAALAGWAFLQWRFSGSWTRSFSGSDSDLFRFPGGLWVSLARAATSVGHDLVFAPVLVAAAVLLFSRRPSSALACLAFVGCVIADLWVGAPFSGPTAVILLGVVALVLLPDRLKTSEQMMLWACVALQVGVAYAGLHHGLAPVADWAHRLMSSGLLSR
jgi:hypothetical protein